MKKILSVGLVCVLGCLYSQANPVNRSRAAEQAAEFLSGAAKSLRVQDLKCIYPQQEQAPVYVFNFETAAGKGFVVMGGESDLTEVLGYSFDHGFPEDKIPDNVQGYLRHYENQINAYQQAVNQGAPHVSTPKTQARADAAAVVAPLLETYAGGAIEYDQVWPYFNMCPDPDNIGRPALTGCLATAMAQICRFYKYPEAGTGSISYTWNGYEYSTDFNHGYDWDNTLCSYKGGEEYTEEQLNAVAQLMKDCGYACEMEYSYDVSVGRYHKMIYGAIEYLGYNPGAYEAFKQMYTEQQWRDLLAGQLDQGMPVFHSGTWPSENVGHAFVCDGYNEDNYFHFNWGWNGSANGWFLLNDLSATADGSHGDYEHGYNDWRRVSLDLRPKREGDKPANIFFYYFGNENQKVFKCRRGAYGKNVAVSAMAEQIVSYAYDSVRCVDAVGVAFWQNGQCVKVLDQKPLCILSLRTASPEFTLYPAKELEAGEYRMSVVSRVSEDDAWKEMPAAPGRIYAYKVIIRNDSTIVMDEDEPGENPYFPPVTNLQAAVDGHSVTLTWKEPEGVPDDFSTYKIFLDGTAKGATQNLHHTLNNVADGIHEVAVKALYNGSESAPVSLTVSVGDIAVERFETAVGLCRVYPNPVKDVFNVETSCAGLFQWIGLDGKVLAEYRIDGKGTRSFAVPSLPSGVNLWRFEGSDGRSLGGKIVIK